MSPIPRTSPAVIRRIDRLARGAHAFHRYAHHPLCVEYSGEVFRIAFGPNGRSTRFCRGCTLAGVGAILGGLMGAWTAPPLWAAATAIPLGLAGASRSARRAGKIATRLLPAGSIAFAIGAGLRVWSPGGALLCGVALAAVGLSVARYRRRGPDRSPCIRCPERTAQAPCRGLAPLVRRERAFQRMAGGWLAAATISTRPAGPDVA
jgi:hypothetical protein